MKQFDWHAVQTIVSAVKALMEAVLTYAIVGTYLMMRDLHEEIELLNAEPHEDDENE